MSPMIIRTLQVGVALIVITVVVLLVLMIVGLVGEDSALRIGLNVTMVITLCMVAGAGLALILGPRAGDSDKPGPQ